ncbi:hypothetical protein [Streptomyces flaveolus]|uniref:hypothetical protein n=1 Tax=Streptomyces flaveolus TaxID=67297 RepID=UPI003D9F16A0
MELVEAGALGGRPEAAATALHRLEEHAGAGGTERALGILARSRALLSDGRTADLLYQEAIERLRHSRVTVHLARTHLVYGEWLRRVNRRGEAREHLRLAFDMLHGFGASAFAERARRGLGTRGESVRQRETDAYEALTAQEAHIARLAAVGKTNVEAHQPTHRRMAFAQGVHQARRGFTYPARRGAGASVTTASRLSMTRKVGSALGPPPSTDVR